MVVVSYVQNDFSRHLAKALSGVPTRQSVAGGAIGWFWAAMRYESLGWHGRRSCEIW